MPRLEPEVEGEPEAVRVRHEDEGKREREENPNGKAHVVGEAFDVGQEERNEKNGNYHGERQGVGDDHSADVIAGLTEKRKAAKRAARQHFVGPAVEDASVAAVGAAEMEGVADSGTEGRTDEGLRHLLHVVQF